MRFYKFWKNTPRLLCICSILFVVFFIAMNFACMVKNVEGSKGFWSVRVTGNNKGLAGQDIYIEVATAYGFYKRAKARPNSYGSGYDGGGYDWSCSIDERLMSSDIQALATAEDKSQAGVKNVWWGPDDVNIEMNDIGKSPAYLDIYVTNKINQQVTFSVHKGSGGYGSALGTFTAEANAKNKKVGTVTDDNFYGNTQNPTWFSAKWGDSYWEKCNYPSGNYGISWGAGRGGPADSSEPGAYFYVGTIQPTLSNAGVSPSQGDTNTNFTYTVTYKHPEVDGGKLFGFNIYIDGNRYSMINVSAAGADEKTGLTYIYNTTLPAGDHQYYFSAIWKVGPTDSQTYNGPIVTEAPPPPPEPEPKIVLSPSQQYSECYAGRTTSCKIIAENKGDKEGNFTLSGLAEHTGWAVNIFNESGAPINSTTVIGLPIGQSKSFTVNITVPNSTVKGEVDNTVVSAKVNGTVHSTTTIITTVKEFPGIILTAIDTEKKIEQSGEEKYLMSVKNEYDKSNNVTISLSAPWQATIVDTNDTNLSSFELPVDGSKDFYVKVKAPELTADDINTYGNTSVSIGITATSNTINKSASVNVTATIKVTSNITLVPISPASGEQKGMVGKEIWYTIEARNGGNTPNILDGISCYGTWSNWRGKVSIYKDRSESLFSDTNKINGIDTGTIPVNGSVNMFVKVKIAEDAADGATETITVKGKLASDLVAEVNTAIKAIAETPGITIYPKAQNNSGKAGQSVFCYFTVRNEQLMGDKFEFTYNTSKNSTATFFDYLSDAELEKFGSVSKLSIYSKEIKTINVSVTIPQASPAGSSIITTIAVRSPISGKSDNATINTTILPSVGIEITSTKNKTSDGTNIAYLLNVTNTGNAADTINIQYASTLDWGAELLWEDGTALNDTNNDSFVDIGKLTAGETKTIKLTIAIPSKIDAGLINHIAVNASSSRETEYCAQEVFNEVSSTEVSIDEKEVYIFSESGRISTTLINGTNITITTTVRNIGTANLESESGFEVRFYIVTNESGKLNYTPAGNVTTIYDLPANSSVKVNNTFFLDVTSIKSMIKAKIIVEVEPIYDKDSNNNIAEKNVTIKYLSAAAPDVPRAEAVDYSAVAGIAGGLCAIGAVGTASAFLFRRRELL